MFSYDYCEKVSINPNNKFNNRTYHYLYPSIKFYDSNTLSNLNSLNISAVTLGDNLYNESYTTNRHFYFTCYTKANNNLYYKALNYLKNTDYFKDEYPQGNIIGDYRTIIYQMPDILNKDIIELFISGRYSEMYTPKQIEYAFSKTLKLNSGASIYNPIYKILLKEENYKKIFSKIIAKDFKVDENITKGIDIEYDYPPRLISEIINY